MTSWIILSQCVFLSPPLAAFARKRSAQSVNPSCFLAIRLRNSFKTAGDSMPLAPSTIYPAVIAPQVLPHFIPPPKLLPIAAARFSSSPISFAYTRITVWAQLLVTGTAFLNSSALTLCSFIFNILSFVLK